MSDTRYRYHIGRSWKGTKIEDDCPCPKAPCGLVDSDNISEECDQHPMWAAKTIRQGHRPEDCPGGQTETPAEHAAAAEAHWLNGRFAEARAETAKLIRALAERATELEREVAELHARWQQDVARMSDEVNARQKRAEQLETALRGAIATIEDLAGQQAMPDDWWEAKVTEYRAALDGGTATPEPNCPECGSGILNGEHIANYKCSKITPNEQE